MKDHARFCKLVCDNPGMSFAPCQVLCDLDQCCVCLDGTQQPSQSITSSCTSANSVFTAELELSDSGHPGLIQLQTPSCQQPHLRLQYGMLLVTLTKTVDSTRSQPQNDCPTGHRYTQTHTGQPVYTSRETCTAGMHCKQ